MQHTSAGTPPKFSDLPISEPILRAVEQIGYERPTEVQAGVIPLVLAGIDLIVQSQTGTGKTAAFTIPIAEMLDSEPGVVQALVLAPTRELALQVSGEFERTGCRERGLDVCTVYGGASIGEQIKGLKTAQVVAATPGRMLDILRRKATNLDELKIFILDEADEMMSMGFEKELEAILEYLPEERQSLMFSATVDESIKNIAAHVLSYPEYLTFSSDSLAAEQIEHYYYMVSGVGRLRDLQRVIEHDEPENALVFCNTRNDSFRVANFLKQQGYDAEVINGELPQAEREKVLAKMRRAHTRFLVATDIAARGIDISFLPCVINYVLPESAEAYIHRTGRTGRAGRKGEAISLISPREIGMFYQLRRAYKFDLVARKLPSEEELIALKERRALEEILAGLDAGKDLDYGRYLRFAEAFAKLPDHRTRLAKLIGFFVAARDRAPDAAGSEAPSTDEAAAADRTAAPDSGPPPAPEPPPEAPPPRTRRRGARAKPEAETATAPPGRSNGAERPDGADGQLEARRKRSAGRPDMATIRLNLGRDKVDSPKQVVALLAELSGLDESDMGSATIHANNTVVEVRKDLADDVVAAVNHQRVGDVELVVTR
jgi:ATP-dependent RNA helicase DeaD